MTTLPTRHSSRPARSKACVPSPDTSSVRTDGALWWSASSITRTRRAQPPLDRLVQWVYDVATLKRATHRRTSHIPGIGLLSLNSM